MRKDKREWANNIAQEAEDAAKCGQMKGVYDATRRLCSEPPKKIDMVRNNEGNLLTKEEEVQQRWKEHFVELLNRPNPEPGGRSDQRNGSYRRDTIRPHN